MANTKISELPSGVPTLAAEVPFVEGGQTRKGTRFAVMTADQVTAGAIAPAALTADSVLLGLNGQPYNPLAEGDVYLPVLTAAYAATRAGSADTIIAYLGDSTVAGLWANGVQTVGNRPFAPPVVAGNLLAASSLGLPVSQDAVFGLGTNTGTYGYDSRVTFTSANWNGASLQWLGGCCFRNDANEASSMNIAFGSTFDEITVYYYQNPGLGSFNIGINGGAAVGATVNTAGSEAMGVATRTVARGTHTVNISRLAGANTVLVFGVVVRDTTTRRVRVYNWGAGGTQTADWIATGVYRQGTAGPLLAPHCVVIKLGINDMLASVTPAQFETNLQTLVDLYRPESDVILCTPNPVNVAQVSLATQYAYRQRVLTVAKRNGLPCNDLLSAMYGIWDAAVAAGLFGPSNDQIHPSSAGYALDARRVADMLEVSKLSFTAAQVTAGAVAPAAVTSSGGLLDAAGNPVATGGAASVGTAGTLQASDGSGGLQAVTALLGARSRPVNHIGFDGQLDFGVGICPAVPAGYTPHPSWYGNYVFTDGSVMVWIPAFYCRIGHVNNPTYARWLLNSVDVQPISAFANLAAANAAGYFLPRMFYNAGQVQLGKFIDKFGCSNNAGTASSLQNGNPLSTNSAHNPIGALTGAPANNYGGCFAAAKTRGAKFHPMMRYDRTGLALLAMAQAQAATSTAACAWWDGTSTGAMGPRGNTNNAFGDSNDAAVSYVGDGHQNCGKTGSGVPFAKTTHNGCDSGVCDLTGNMWEVSPGVTCVTTSGAITAITQANPAVVTQPGHGRTTGSVCRIDGGQMTQANNKHFTITVIDADRYSLGVDSTAWTAYTSGATATHGTFHALALSADAAALTGGNTLATDAWGAAGLAAHSQVVPVTFGAGLGFDLRYGNAANQVISGAVSGDEWLAASLGFVASGAALGTAGIAAFGQDWFYAFLQGELCPIAGGTWNVGSAAGAWAVSWNRARSTSDGNVGFRAASYL